LFDVWDEWPLVLFEGPQLSVGYFRSGHHTSRAGHLSSWVPNVFHITQYQQKHLDDWLPPDLMALLGPRARLFGARMNVAASRNR
jgi:hypothetical protein